MAFISYAKSGEDAVLFQALQASASGSYIDLECNEPPDNSTTQAFYDRGWSGYVCLKSDVLAERYRFARPRDKLIGHQGIDQFILTAPGMTKGKIDFIRLHESDIRSSMASVDWLGQLSAKIIVLVKNLKDCSWEAHRTIEDYGYRLAIEDEFNVYYVLEDCQDLLTLARVPNSIRNAGAIKQRYCHALDLLDQKKQTEVIAEDLNHAEIPEDPHEGPSWRRIVDRTKQTIKKALKKIFNIPIFIIDQCPELKSGLVSFLARYPEVSMLLRKILGRPGVGQEQLEFVESEVAKEPDAVKMIYLGLCRGKRRS